MAGRQLARDMGVHVGKLAICAAARSGVRPTVGSTGALCPMLLSTLRFAGAWSSTQVVAGACAAGEGKAGQAGAADVSMFLAGAEQQQQQRQEQRHEEEGGKRKKKKKKSKD